MKKEDRNSRREFLKKSCLAIAMSASPGAITIAQTPIQPAIQMQRQRLEWDAFKQTAFYPDFVRAIKLMQANTDPNDRRSWAYWTNVHLNFCPHGIEYFLAWHRGYLYYFEEQLRAVAGNPALTLPYWNCYKSPVIPAEFTSPASDNPLYTERLNTNVSAALTTAPFSNTLDNFERGAINSFEASLEGKPHDPVHDIIGSTMATMNSPRDAIFWLHHANMDRLWNAWAAAKGRHMPDINSKYWKGQFDYGIGLAMNRNQTMSTRNGLGYFYDNETFPTTTTQAMKALVLAPAATAAKSAANAIPASSAVMRPPIGEFELSLQRPIDAGQISLVGARYIGLDERSISARLPLDLTQAQQLIDLSIAASKLEPLPTATVPLTPTAQVASAQLVLDGIHLTDAGQKGGYFYQIYLNLPPRVDTLLAESKYFVGSIGAFVIAGALHYAAQHGDHARGSQGAQSGSARLVYPLDSILGRLSAEEIRNATVSFVRANGENVQLGEMIRVGEIRIEVLTNAT